MDTSAFNIYYEHNGIFTMNITGTEFLQKFIPAAAKTMSLTTPFGLMKNWPSPLPAVCKIKSAGLLR